MRNQHTDVMLDIETLGTAPGSVILSIGAVAFNLEAEHPLDGSDYAHSLIATDSCRLLGMTTDDDTMAWWERQSPDAKKLLQTATKPATADTHVVAVLAGFSRWMPLNARVWGNGSDFDNVLLAAAYRKCGLPLPWLYSMSRCFRTMKRTYSWVPKPEFQGVQHDALADAINQTQHLISIWRAIRPS